MKRICKLAALLGLVPGLALATVHPFLSVSGGLNRADVANRAEITFMPPFSNLYQKRHNTDTEFAYGFFLGFEYLLKSNLRWQLGVAANQNAPLEVTGTVFQFSDLNFGNLKYQFGVRNRRYFLQSKLLFSVHDYFPYIVGAVGQSINVGGRYKEVGKTTDGVPMLIPFANKTYRSLGYLLGIGFDVDIAPHVRFGMAYHFLDLGKAGIGMTPLQTDNRTITLKNLEVDEFIAEFTYLI